MELDNPFLGITPESFNTINVHFPRRKPPFMINSQMPISTKHQSIIASKFICINNRSSSDCFNSHVHQRLCSNILNNFNPDRTIPFITAEYWDFPSSTSSSLSFSSSSKVALVHFDFTLKESIVILTCQNSHAYKGNCPQNSWIKAPPSFL